MTGSRNQGNSIYFLSIIGLCTVICGGEDYADMEAFGIEREDFLRKFLKLPNGIPDSDTFRRLFERLDPTALSECLVNWLRVELPERCVIAVDGKTIRDSRCEDHKAYHVVSAFVSEAQITLVEVTVPEKTNEITAVPELLDLLYMEDAVITAHSMSCQKKIVEQTTSQKADYCIALKESYPLLCKDAADYFADAVDAASFCRTMEKDHERIEIRSYYLSTDMEWLEQKEEWKGPRAVGMVRSRVLEGKKERVFIRYFLTSLTDISEFSGTVRKHWSIENQLHWCLDVIFREDAARARKANSPLNMNVLRKMALSLLKQAKRGRLSKRKMMFKASLNPEVLLSVLLAGKK